MSDRQMAARSQIRAPHVGNFEGFKLVIDLECKDLIGRPWTIAGHMTTPEGQPTTLQPGDIIHFDMEKNWISVIRDNRPLTIISLIDGAQQGFLRYLGYSHVVVKAVLVATLAMMSAFTGLTFRRLDKPGFAGTAFCVE